MSDIPYSVRGQPSRINQISGQTSTINEISGQTSTINEISGFNFNNIATNTLIKKVDANNAGNSNIINSYTYAGSVTSLLSGDPNGIITSIGAQMITSTIGSESKLEITVGSHSSKRSLILQENQPVIIEDDLNVTNLDVGGIGTFPTIKRRNQIINVEFGGVDVPSSTWTTLKTFNITDRLSGWNFVNCKIVFTVRQSGFVASYGGGEAYRVLNEGGTTNFGYSPTEFIKTNTIGALANLKFRMTRLNATGTSIGLEYNSPNITSVFGTLQIIYSNANINVA